LKLKLTIRLKKEVATDTKENYKKIVRKISHMQNGDVAKILRNMGLDYKLSYGVSIPHLRQVVSEFEPNNELAFLLWERDIRETRILASSLFDVTDLPIEKARIIAKKIVNQELREQYSRNLFARLPYLPGLVETWMAGTLEEKTLALYSVGWHIRQGGSLADDLKAMVFTQIGEMAAIDQVMVHQSLSFVMQSLSVVSDVYNAEMKELAVRLMQSEKLNVHRLGEEFLWFNTK